MRAARDDGTADDTGAEVAAEVDGEPGPGTETVGVATGEAWTDTERTDPIGEVASVTSGLGSSGEMSCDAGTFSGSAVASACTGRDASVTDHGGERVAACTSTGARLAAASARTVMEGRYVCCTEGGYVGRVEIAMESSLVPTGIEMSCPCRCGDKVLDPSAPVSVVNDPAVDTGSEAKVEAASNAVATHSRLLLAQYRPKTC